VRTGGVEPPQPEAAGLQPVELTGAQRPRARAADRIRAGTARITTSNAAVTPQPPRAGTTGLEPAAYRLTSECSPSELRPQRVARVGFEPTSRAHEAREDSRSSTALRVVQVWPAGVEPAVSGSRSRRGGRLPYGQTMKRNPRRDSNPRFRAENPASQPLDHGGMTISRRSWNRTRPYSLSASRAATDTDLRRELRRQDSNLRLAINNRASYRSTTPERV
jgi:hypothetical protein